MPSTQSIPPPPPCEDADVRKFLERAEVDIADRGHARMWRDTLKAHEEMVRRREARHRMRIKFMVGFIGWAMSGVSLAGLVSYLMEKKWPTLFP